MKTFIKSQPDDMKGPPAQVSKWQLPLVDVLRFEATLAEFDATANPAYAIETYLLAAKLGIYPPQRILQWVGQAFQTWSEEQGLLPMDKAMQLKPGRGKTSPYVAALLESRNSALMWEMDRLIVLGANITEAAGMIEGRLQQDDWNKSRHDLDDLKAGALVTMYAAVSHEQRQLRQETLEEIKFDPELARMHLKRYPRLYIPESLKSML